MTQIKAFSVRVLHKAVVTKGPKEANKESRRNGVDRPTTAHSTTTEVIEITICVRFDCDTTTTRLRRKIDMFIFCSRRMASNGSRHATS